MSREVSEFYSRLKYLCEHINKSINRVEKELGYQRNVLHNYRYGSIPSGSRLIELANYFGVTPEYLINKRVVSALLPTDITLFFQLLSEEQKKEIYKISRNWHKSQ